MKSITAVTCAICLIALAPCASGQRLVTLYNITGDNPIGFAYNGSGFNCGTVYRLQPPGAKGDPWIATVLYSSPDILYGPCSPAGAPVVGNGGTLYGITSGGGAYFFGAFYDLQPPESPAAGWSENVLYNFDAPGTNIGYPVSGLVKGPGRSYYVLTSTLTLCQLQPPSSPRGPWPATILYSFLGPAAVPLNSLAPGLHGVLYGTSPGGPNIGDVFQLTPLPPAGGAWNATLLHGFDVKGMVGNPFALTVAPDGTIYGTAYGWDPPLGTGFSAIFRLTPPATPGGQWVYATLTTPIKGQHFNTPVALSNGNLYGGITTGTGGSIYELQPPSAPGSPWTMTTLYSLTNEVPSGNLVVGANGIVYGATAAAPGQPFGGTVLAIMP